MTITGKSLRENIRDTKVINEEVIRPLNRPVAESGGTYVLRGNLAPDGCVIKPSAADPRLLRHTGPALVFKNYNHMISRMNDETLEVNQDSVLVLQNAGPLGGPGMPEWGMLPIPQKLLQAGVRDMVRISDARMSGTSYGTCILHVSPESYLGGPLALVEDGDMIELDAEARKLELKVSDSELRVRREKWQPPLPRFARGFGHLFSRHITQAHQGCDFDFLNPKGTQEEPEIH